MADKKAKLYRNNSSNTFHLKPRKKGELYFEFHPGDVIQATDQAEADLFERTELIGEHKEEVAPEAPRESSGKKKG